jgi:malate synthase
VSATEAAVVRAPVPGRASEVLTPRALSFVAGLHRRFNATRVNLLRARDERHARIAAGEMPDFLPETRAVREGDWRIAPIPRDLQDRRVEITGPVDPAINNLMEDAATAEISRSQIWQWIRHGKVERSLVTSFADEAGGDGGRWPDARAVFEAVSLSEEFVEFLTSPAYEYLD